MKWIDMAPVLPEAENAGASIKHHEVTKEDAARAGVRVMVTGDASLAVSPGVYAQLWVGETLMMSDTQMERRTNSEFIYQAKGHVLVAGLGIGMVVPLLLAKEAVTKVTIVEKYQDVIDLVEKPLRTFLGKKKLGHKDRLEIVCSDIHDFKAPRGVKYDTIYFDIWSNMRRDNLTEMDTLHKKFARRRVKGGWIGSWYRTELLSLRRQGRWR